MEKQGNIPSKLLKEISKKITHSRNIIQNG